MPSKVHDNSNSLDKPASPIIKQKPVNPKTLGDRINEADFPDAKRSLLKYELRKYGVKGGKSKRNNKSRRNKSKRSR